jgi:CubicO group peptidase (beta-lactamase class C family)
MKNHSFSSDIIVSLIVATTLWACPDILASTKSEEPQGKTAAVQKTFPLSTNLSEQIDILFQVCAERDLAGAAVVVLHGSQVLHSKAYGLANVEKRVPNTTHTRFCLASVTKSFTALAVLQLVERGLLRLDDPLSCYLPDFVGGDKITIHHLLTHTAGLPDFIPFAEASRRQPESQPGERLNYSNIGYLALGRVIEKASGKTYEEYLQEAIWRPLGMTNTGVDRRQEPDSGRATGYVVGSQGALRNADYTDTGENAAAGGLYSTAEDLTLWIQGLLAGKIVSLPSLAKATTPVKLNGERSGVYGYGFMLSPFRGVRQIAHGGDISGYNTWFGIFPDAQLAIIVLSNIGMRPPGPIPSAPDLGHRIAAMVLGERLGPEWPAAVRVSPEVLQRYVGKYRLEAPTVVTAAAGETLEITLEGETLFACGKQGKGEIYASSENTFYFKQAPVAISFVPASPGGQMQGVMTLAGIREYRLARTP